MAVAPGADIDLSRAMQAADDDYDAVMRAADALFSTKGGNAASSGQPAGGAASSGAAASERPAGRILQAIEETPADPFAELEALHAPKRRGRKPGSKNKPKVPVPERPSTEPRAMIPAAVSIAALPAARPALVADAVVASAGAQAARGERFGWVRTKLRPGERWKRRIPKVAW